jgi:hypothetical protein
MAPRKVALARAFPILIGIVVFGALIVLLALRTMRGIEQSEAVAARFEGLARVCGSAASNGPVGTDAAPTPRINTQGADVRAVAFRLVEGEWVYDATALPLALRAADAEEAQMVLCLGPSAPLVTTACGVGENGVAPTRVYGEALTVRLVNAASEELLAEDVLPSAPEVGCREEEGPVLRVSPEQIGDWLRAETGD